MNIQIVFPQHTMQGPSINAHSYRTPWHTSCHAGKRRPLTSHSTHPVLACNIQAYSVQSCAYLSTPIYPFIVDVEKPSRLPI